MQHGKLRSYRGSRLVNEFVLRFSSFNSKDTFKTGEALFYIFLMLVCRESNHEQGRQANQKNQKKNKKETRENLVDDEIPLQGGSHTSFSHEASLEPTTKRRKDLGAHNVYTHCPEVARSVKGPKSHGPRAENAMAESYLVQKILVIWLEQIAKFPVKIVNLETIIDTQSWNRI